MEKLFEDAHFGDQLVFSPDLKFRPIVREKMLVKKANLVCIASLLTTQVCPSFSEDHHRVLQVSFLIWRTEEVVTTSRFRWSPVFTSQVRISSPRPFC
jgi:hypothetical protein